MSDTIKQCDVVRMRYAQDDAELVVGLVGVIAEQETHGDTTFHSDMLMAIVENEHVTSDMLSDVVTLYDNFRGEYHYSDALLNKVSSHKLLPVESKNILDTLMVGNAGLNLEGLTASELEQ